MSASLAAWAGWLAAVGAVGCVGVERRRLARRAELVARACHEVRGPLAALSLGLHGLAREEQRERSRVTALELELRRAGLALEDLAVAPSGRRAAERSELIDVAGLVREAGAGWQGVARALGRELRIGAMPDGALWVRGDRVRLAQALANLLGNAMEHGGAAIELCAGATPGGVRIEVSDDGPGLPAALRELTRRPRAGIGRRGRGLAIAAEIAGRHGGRLAPAPAVRGARLVLDLPAVGAEVAA